MTMLVDVSIAPFGDYSQEYLISNFKIVNTGEIVEGFTIYDIDVYEDGHNKSFQVKHIREEGWAILVLKILGEYISDQEKGLREGIQGIPRITGTEEAQSAEKQSP